MQRRIRIHVQRVAARGCDSSVRGNQRLDGEGEHTFGDPMQLIYTDTLAPEQAHFVRMACFIENVLSLEQGTQAIANATRKNRRQLSIGFLQGRAPIVALLLDAFGAG